MIRDRESGQGKGFGYVLLKTKSLAAKALALDGEKLERRELRDRLIGLSGGGRLATTTRAFGSFSFTILVVFSMLTMVAAVEEPMSRCSAWRSSSVM